MLPDLPGTLVAMIVFALVALAPGWAVGYWLNLLSFRSRFITYKLALALVLSLAMSPIVLVLIVRYTNLRVGAGLVLAVDLMAIGAIVHAMRARQRGTRASERITRARVRLLRTTALIAIAWMLLAFVLLFDVRMGDRLHISVPWTDHNKRASWIDAIVRTGVPPNNPATYPGRPVKFFYYYGWYTWAAVAQTLAGGAIRPLHAVIAGVVWTGWAFIGSLALACQYLTGVARARLRASWLTATLLLGVTGLDIVPGALRLFLFLSAPAGDRTSAPRTIEWWNDQVTGFVDMLLWVPHHVAGTIVGIVAIALFREIRARASGRMIAAQVACAIALASLATLSLYVALPLGIFLAVYAVICLLQRRTREAATLAFAGVVAAAIASPYMYDLLTAPGATSGIAFGIREFGPTSYAMSVRGAAPSTIKLVNFFMLPLNYLMEFGFFALGGIVYWLWRRGEKRPIDRLACGLFWTSLLTASFLRSSISANDLGWRAIVWAQVVLLVWSVEPASAMWSALFGTKTISPAGDALIDRFPRTMSMMVLLIALGVSSTLYDLFLLRCSFSLWPSKDVEPPRALAMRQAYEWIDRNLPRDTVLQHNTELGMDVFSGHYGNRQVCVAEQQISASQSMTLEQFEKLVNRIHEPFMIPRPIPIVRQLAQDLGITAFVVKDTDANWTHKDTWFWTQPAVFENQYVRVILVKDLSAR